MAMELYERAPPRRIKRILPIMVSRSDHSLWEEAAEDIGRVGKDFAKLPNNTHGAAATLERVQKHLRAMNPTLLKPQQAESGDETQKLASLLASESRQDAPTIFGAVKTMLNFQGVPIRAGNNTGLVETKPFKQRKYDFFICHCQRTGQDQAKALAMLLKDAGQSVWFDMMVDEITEQGMERGVADSRNFLIFLSKDIMSRPFCQQEQRWAKQYGCTLLGVKEDDVRHGKANFADEKAAAPEDLKHLLDNIEFEPYQRREQYVKPFIDTLLGRARSSEDDSPDNLAPAVQRVVSAVNTCLMETEHQLGLQQEEESLVSGLLPQRQSFHRTHSQDSEDGSYVSRLSSRLSSGASPRTPRTPLRSRSRSRSSSGTAPELEPEPEPDLQLQPQPEPQPQPDPEPEPQPEFGLRTAAFCAQHEQHRSMHHEDEPGLPLVLEDGVVDDPGSDSDGGQVDNPLAAHDV